MKRETDLITILLSLAAIALAVFSAAACEPPPDVMPMAGGADGGIVAVQQALTFPSRPISVSLAIHFTYHPAADGDISTTFGSMEISPSPYPVTANNHDRNAWHGFPDIGNISPVSTFGINVATQQQSMPQGNRQTVAYGTVNCTFSTAYRDNTGTVGISAVDCFWTSPTFTLVNNDLWISWAPGCKNGQVGNGWASEYIDSVADARVKWYTVNGASFPNWALATVNHGSPFYDRPYWQRMAQQCADGGSMWNHPGPWHDVVFQKKCGGPGGVLCSDVIAWDVGYSWN